MPDDNKRELEPEVSITPNMRDSGRQSKQLFVQDSEPYREPPLTSKERMFMSKEAVSHHSG